jgi:hypothetical protein
MIKIGDKVKIKTFESDKKPILWDEVFEGAEGVVTYQSGGQYNINFGYSLKLTSCRSDDWKFGKFWEKEFEII